MAQAKSRTILRHLRDLVGPERWRELSDADLLQRFVAQRDEAAFAALVGRHGPLVWGVCRQLLGHDQDAEDAFQAAFLALSRQAAGLRRGEAVAGWLHRVAGRIARRAAMERTKRRRHEQQAGTAPRGGRVGEGGWQELQSILQEELDRLPEKYRSAFIVCCLEGKSRAEAAHQLGIKEGTLSSRLAHARQVLHERLARRGVELPAVLTAAALVLGETRVPATMVQATSRAAALFATGGNAATGYVSTQAAALAEEVIKAMIITKLKIGAALVLLTGVLMGGMGLAAYQVQTNKPPATQGHETTGSAARDAGQPEPEGNKQPRTDHYGDPLPPGVLVRMGTVRWRHAHSISGIVFSRDGRIVASSGSQDGLIHFWDVSTGRECRRIDTGDRNVTALALSPDGKTLASAGVPRNQEQPQAPGRVTLWDLATGRRTLQIERTGWSPGDVAFAPNGKTLATTGTTGEEGSIHLWDAATGKELLRIPADPPVLWVVFSPNGGTLASYNDGTIRLWDPASGRELRRVEVEIDPDNASGFAISPDGKTLAAVAWDPAAAEGEKHVVLWDLATGKKRLHYRLAREGHAMVGGAVAFSPDGRTLAASGNDGTITLWDLVAGKQHLRIREASEYVVPLAFSPDSKTLAGGFADKTVCLWGVATGRELTNTTEAHRDNVTQLAFTPDGRDLATASGDSTIRLWDAATGRQRLRLGGNDSWVRAIALSPDGKVLASSGLDDTVRLWDVATGKQLHQLPGHGRYGGSRSLAFSADGQTLASWGDDWQLRVWEVGTGKEVLNRQPRLTGVPEFPAATDQPNRDRERERRSAFYRAALTPDGKKLVVVGPEQTHLVDVGTGEEWLTFPGEPVPYALTISHDGRVLALGTRQDEGLLMELATGKELLRIKGLGQVCALALSPDGKRLAASVGRSPFLTLSNLHLHGTTIGLWDARTGQKLLTRQSPAPVYALAFSPDGKTLAAGLSDTTALVWDLAAAASKERAAEQLADKDLEKLWRDLSGEDAGQAYAAVWALVAVPEKAVPFLEKRLRPERGVDPQRIEQLLADLDSDRFPVREAAFRELDWHAGEVQPALRRALARKPSPEVQRRLEDLLAPPPGRVRSPEILRGLRAIQTLENIGASPAQRILESLAQGAPEARLTQEAKASLERLAKRPAAAP